MVKICKKNQQPTWFSWAAKSKRRVQFFVKELEWKSNCQSSSSKFSNALTAIVSNTDQICFAKRINSLLDFLGPRNQREGFKDEGWGFKGHWRLIGNDIAILVFLEEVSISFTLHPSPKVSLLLHFYLIGQNRILLAPVASLIHLFIQLHPSLRH